MHTDVKKFMRLAVALAAKAKGQTFPNPLVGAVLVKNNRVVGRGFHQKAGGPHAEIIAIRQAGNKTKGATLFCTLEPCAHTGRTGPCVENIIAAGISKVYVGMIDPNPLNGGRGIRRLRNAGIDVRVSLCQAEIHRLNEAFIKAMTKGMPRVTVKIAESLDGKTATRTGESQWITSPASRKFSHDMRRFFDGIMVGINTVRQDNPLLEPSPRYRNHRLTKIIVDSGLKISLASRLLKTRQPVVIATVKTDPLKEKKLLRMGAEVIRTPSAQGRVDLKKLLIQLHKREIRSVLVEGGAELIGSLLDEKLADAAMITIAPKMIGGRDALGAVGGCGVGSLRSAIRVKNISLHKIKEDLFFEGSLEYC
ncbi:MAG: bifunctional diaminohydroxyphosphoribosylaminopyrimidine deaminase/5-amino-6-(5-phosphoribosylamino)uracil reductase RibD [Candidatus Omnitrophota bacterium]